MDRYKKQFKTYTNLEFTEEDLFQMLESHLDWSAEYRIFEAVVNINPELQEIKKILINTKQNFYKLKNNLNSIELFLDELFLSRKLLFKYTSITVKGYVGAGKYYEPTNEITILFSNNLLNINTDIEYLNFVEEFCSTIGHELVHRAQAIKIEYLQIRDKVWKDISNKTNSNIDKKGREITPEKKYKNYLAIDQEIMAYAWKIINNFRTNGITDSYIKKFLRTNTDIEFELGGQILKDYLILFSSLENNGNQYKDVLKKLYKYMYEYLEL